MKNGKIYHRIFLIRKFVLTRFVFNLKLFQMNTNYKKIFKIVSIIYASILFFSVNAQQTYTFTNAGQTGSVGPSQGQVNTSYLSTNLNGSVIVTGGIQSFTIPNTGLYQLDVYGASGGNPANYTTRLGGLGSRMRGDFMLTGGDVLQILVGQQGGNGTGGSGGGGGTYVTCNNTIIIAAGGGGGACSDNNGANSTTLTSGTTDHLNGTTPGGTNGGGGSACNVGSPGANHGGAGAGYLGNGATSTAPTPGGGGFSFVNGGSGGAGGTAGAWGGFGGGGGATQITVGGGGGGGYSGGAGGQQVNYCTPGINRSGGGGGGSYNSGTNQLNVGGINNGHGRVIITDICPLNVTASTSNSLLPSICAGSSVSLSTNGVSNYSWSTGNNTSSVIVVSPMVTTIYSVSATTSLNCNATAFITVIVSSGLPALTVNSSTNAVCLGSSVSFTAMGALSYTWSNAVANGANFIPTATSVYTVLGQNGCGISSATTLVNVAPLPVTAMASNTLICQGYPATLTAVAAANVYSWMPNNATGSVVIVAPTANTIYTVSVTDGTCSGTQTVFINTQTTPTVAIAATSSMICAGESVSLTASGADNYLWLPGSLTGSMIVISPTTSLLYSVDGVNSFGCLASSQQVVVVNQPPMINVTTNKVMVCSGGSAILTGSGANSYTWVSGPNTATYLVNPNGISIYTLIASHLTNSCVAARTITVSTLDPSVSVISSTAICSGQSVTLTASGATSYTWNGVPSPSGNFVASPTSNDVYTLSANTQSNSSTGFVNCASVFMVTVTVNPNPTITIQPNRNAICRSESNTLTASGALNYSWGPLGTNSVLVVSPTITTVYTVTGSDANGCETSKIYQAIVSSCSGFSDVINSGVSIKIFPNPNKGQFIVLSEYDIQLQLWNELGQLLSTFFLNTGNNHRAEINDMAPGIYFVTGDNELGALRQKVVIVK